MTLLRRGAAAIVIAASAVVLTACSAVSPTTSQPAASGDSSTATTAASTDGGLFGGGWMTWVLVALVAVMVFFMWRSSRKRKADAAKLQTAMVPGVTVMTTFGLFGKLVKVDEIGNTADIEVSPGNIVKVHRQTLAKVVDASEVGGAGGSAPRSVEEAMEIAEREQAAREASQDAEFDREVAELTGEDSEPKYGERVKDADGDDADGEGTGEGTKKS